jgi:2-polyprenyl-6-hydroxyphenyl methylase/3-demethylubiquinone-9 3-methyltransferase
MSCVSAIDERAPLASRRVLDVGCGGGAGEAMAHRGATVLRIDLGSENLEVAAPAAGTGVSVDYAVVDVEALRASSRRARDRHLPRMLEHVPEPQRVVAACSALLTPGARRFSTISHQSEELRARDRRREYVLGLLPRGARWPRR